MSEYHEQPASRTLKVSLIVDYWRGKSGGMLTPEAELALEVVDLHGGSTFPATITLDADTAEELAMALQAGYRPVFWMGGRT